MGITIRMFGSLRVVTEQAVLGPRDFPSRKSKQVLEILALAAGQAVSRDRLLDLVWGTKLPNNPVSTVDHTLSILRSALGGGPDIRPIVTEGGRYRLDLAIVDIDLVRFHTMVDAAVGQPDPEGYLSLLDAVAMADGDVLEDEPYAEWALEVRDRYATRLQRVLLDIGRRALAHDDVEVALEVAARARHRSASVSEEAFTLNVAALLRLGRRDEARELIGELEQRLASEYSAVLSPEASMLRSILRSSGTASRSDLVVAVDAKPTSAIDVIPFVGRDHEMAILDDAVERTMHGGNELIVVEGPLGVGKSRLFAEFSDRLTGCAVHTFSCLPSDLEHDLFVATRLVRVCAHHAGLPYQPPPQQSVSSLFDQLADVLEATGPTVIIVDDLQWADPGSVALLAGLARPDVVRSLLVVVGRRPAIIDDDRLPARAVSRVVQLGLLTRSEVESLPIDGAWAETGGHPGLLTACLEAARIGGRLSANVVRDVMGGAGLAGSMALTVLGAASVLGSPFSVIELAHSLALPSSVVADLLEAPTQLLFLRPVPSSDDGFEFTAALTRRVFRTADRARLLASGVPSTSG